MSGNVYEWCVNEHENPKQKGLEGFAPKEVRGGSWQWDHKYSGCTVRGGDVPDFRTPDHGFRVARSAPISARH